MTDTPAAGEPGTTAAAPAAASTTPSAVPTVEEVREAMHDVVDPELMVNVVDLGLLYGVQVDEQGNCTLDMTLTSPTCPLTDRIEYDTQMVLEGLVSSVAINWVWLPPWNLDMITEDGREQLRAIGYNV